MLKRLGLLLVVLSLVAFTTGCSLFGSDDSSTPTTTNVLTVEGTLTDDTNAPTGAPALAAPALAASISDAIAGTIETSLTFQGIDGNTVSGATGTFNPTAKTYSANFALSTDTRVFVLFTTKTTKKPLFKRYLGLIPAYSKLSASATVSNVNVTVATTAQAVVIAETAKTNSTVADAINTYIVNPNSIKANSTTFAGVDNALIANVSVIAPLNNQVVVNIMTLVTAITKVVTVPALTSVASVTDVLASVDGLAAVDQTVSAQKANITASVTVANVTNTAIDAAKKVPVINQISFDNTLTENIIYDSRLSTIGAQTFNMTPLDTAEGTFKVIFSTSLSSTLSTLEVVLDVTETISGVTPVTRRYCYPDSNATSTSFKWSDDFTTPAVSGSQISFTLKPKTGASTRVHQLNAGTYAVKVITLKGVMASDTTPFGGLSAVTGSIIFTTSTVTTPGEPLTVNFITNDNSTINIFIKNPTTPTPTPTPTPSVASSKIKGGTFEITFDKALTLPTTGALVVEETSNGAKITRTYYLNQPSLVDGTKTFDWSDDFGTPTLNADKTVLSFTVKSTAKHTPPVGSYLMKTLAMDSNAYSMPNTTLTVTQ